MSVVAFIPARGGSKRLPRKNVLPFRGRPMIAWTIEAAQRSQLFSDVIVSTEDDEIAAVAKSANATVLRRPDEIADDQSRIVDVLVHWLDRLNSPPERFCLLLANCPLRNAEHIRESLDLMGGATDAVMSVTRYGWTYASRAMRLGPQGLEPIFPGEILLKSQKFPETFCPSGAIYWTTPAVIWREREFIIERLRPYEMPWHLAIDIDELYDFRLAEAVAFCLDHGFRFE
jgi:N-acylneuraminate cytidylyltransferase